MMEQDFFIPTNSCMECRIVDMDVWYATAERGIWLWIQFDY